ncbi:MAG: four helix bundle protein [Balneolaceae bacterium]
MKAEDLKKRTKLFALSIISLYRKLPKTGEAKIVGNQLLRCGTSVGSNYRAACRGRSNREFYAKLCIVVEEADETVFWLEILDEAHILSSSHVQPLLKEATEILAIMASSRKTAGKRI